MAKFQVTVEYITKQVCFTTLDIEAEDEEQAKDHAVVFAQEGEDVDWSKDEVIDGEMNAIDATELEP